MAGFQLLNKSRPYITRRVPLPSERPRQVASPAAPASTAPAKPKPAPHEYPAWDAPTDYGQSVNTPIDPTELHLHLDVAPYVRMVKFTNEKHLMNYRALLYKVNVQGKYRYATRREGWSSLIILRLK